jgi:hypothetical protein
MLPQTIVRCAATTLLFASALVGCGNEATPEARVRAVVSEAEQAAEARDLGGILEHVSESYRDGEGTGRDELSQRLRGWLALHPSVHLLTRVEGVEFPYRDYARVRLTVGALGREAAGATAFDVAADVHDVVLELRLEDDAWRVVRAEWRSTRRD